MKQQDESDERIKSLESVVKQLGDSVVVMSKQIEASNARIKSLEAALAEQQTAIQINTKQIDDTKDTMKDINAIEKDLSIFTNKNEQEDDEEKTHLCFSFMDYTSYNPMVYSVKILQLADLFRKPNHDDPHSVLLNLITSREDHSERSGNGIALANDGCLYVSAQSTKMLRYLPADLRPTQVFGTIGLTFVKPKELSPMKNPKVTPIVVAINQCIHVLSRHTGYGLGVEDPFAFEAYDISKCQWISLPSPPCMFDPDSCTSPKAIMSYFVHDKYLSISTACTSYDFNTETKEWGDCYLLSGRPFRPRSSLIYKDHLLYIRYGVSLVAYKIVSGKVVENPIEILANVWPPFKDGYFDLLVYLGGSKFCMVFREGDVLNLAKFRLVECGGELICEEAVELSSIQLANTNERLGVPYQVVAF